MQVTEQKSEGLKRELSVVVPATDLEARLQTRLHELKGQVNLRGFRPGKVPIAHLRRVYGERAMAEIVKDIIDNKPGEVISERNERPAMQPKVDMTEDEAEAAKILRGEDDFAFTISYETLPSFELADYSGLVVERPVVEISDEEVEDQVKRVADSAREYETKDAAAETGDRVTIDFVGKIDGEPFEGGAAEDSNLVIGSNQFIPGFEEQLVGAKAGDTPTLEVTFPEEYGAAHLAGKAATFDVTVKEVATPKDTEIDDELAKKLGLESVDRLREVVREQIESQYGQATRQKVKRQILDQLDKTYDFELPEQLVQTEFDNIWRQVQQELEQNGKTFADEDTTEEEARAEYQRLAERRVRLGLVLSEIGEKVGVQVSDEELQRAVFDQVRRFPGQEQQVYEHFQNNPQAVVGLRAPLYEEKVVDHLLEQASVTDKTVTKDELLAEDEDETGKSGETDETAAAS